MMRWTFAVGLSGESFGRLFNTRSAAISRRSLRPTGVAGIFSIDVPKAARERSTMAAFRP
jgi:hypothetical protein